MYSSRALRHATNGCVSECTLKDARMGRSSAKIQLRFAQATVPATARA